MKTKHWILLFAVLLGASALVFLWGRSQKQQGVTARVLQDGQLLREIRLDEIREEFRFTVWDADGHYNIVQVEPGRICIREADCPDRLCAKHAAIRNSGETIICLPHKLIVEVRDETE